MDGSACALVGRMAQLMGIIVDALAMCGLTPNLSNGKTEAVVHVVGPGSRKARTELRIDRDARIEIHATSATYHLACVPANMHLGNMHATLGKRDFCTWSLHPTPTHL